MGDGGIGRRVGLRTDRAICEGSSPFRPTTNLNFMKVTIENKKGLDKDLKVFVDKKTINSYVDKKYDEIKDTVNLKGFRLKSSKRNSKKTIWKSYLW